MICRDVLPILSEYMDGELQTEQVALVEEHLEACSSCRHELATLKQVTQTLASTCEIEPPPFLLAQIEAATVNRPTIARKVRRILDRIPQSPRRVGLTTALATVGIFAAVLITHSVNHTPAHVSTIAARPPVHGVTVAQQPVTVEKAIPAATSSGIHVAIKSAVDTSKQLHRRGLSSAKHSTSSATLVVATKPGQESAVPVKAEKLMRSSDESDMPSPNVPADAVVDSAKTSVASASKDDEGKIIKVAVAASARSVKLDDPSEMQQLRTQLRRKYIEAEMGQSVKGGRIPIGIASIRF